MRVRVVGLGILFLLAAPCARAEQDFYGIQIKNELWARNLVLQTGPPADPADLSQGPVLDHAVHAEASLKEVADDKIDFRVTVFNDSEKALSTDSNFRDFFIFTKDGRKYPLIDSQTDTRLDTLEPKASVTFNPSLGNLEIRNSDVQMILCSFDLGKTRLFLFPWSRKDDLTKLSSPPPPPIPVKPAKPEKLAKPAKEPKPVKEAKAPKEPKAPKAPKAKVKGPFQTFVDWLGLEKEKKVPTTWGNGEPVKPTQVEPVSSGNPAPAVAAQPPAAAPPKTQDRLSQAIKNFVYVPASGTSGAAPKSAETRGPAVGSAPPSSPPVAAAPPPAAAVPASARVVDFNRLYSFITLNRGSRDGLTKNAMLKISRDGKVIARARVKQVREAVSAASLIQESVKTEVRAGDQVDLV